MKKNYLKPTIEMTDCFTDDCLLQASVNAVATEGLGEDPAEQIIFGTFQGEPLSSYMVNAW